MLKKVLQYRTIAFLFLSLIILYGTTIGHANVLHYIIQRYTKTALFHHLFFKNHYQTFIILTPHSFLQKCHDKYKAKEQKPSFISETFTAHYTYTTIN